MKNWQTTLRLAHLVLTVLSERLDTSGNRKLRERALSLKEKLEHDPYDDACYDEPGVEDEQFFSYSEDAFWTDDEQEDDSIEVLLVDPEDGQSLLETMGLSWEGLVDGIRCYESDAMGFQLLLQMEGICRFFADCAKEHMLERDLDSILAISAEDDHEVHLLYTHWHGLEALHFELCEEAALQWLLASNFLCQSVELSLEALAPKCAVLAAIDAVLDARKRSSKDFAQKLRVAQQLVEPRILEVARISNPDGDFELELLHCMNGSIDCNRASLQLPKAVQSYLSLVQ